MRLQFLQALRAFAAISVLALHDEAWKGSVTNAHSLGNGLFSWGWIGVDIFFCISGFIMAWVHGKDLDRPDRAKLFALKRFFRIYPPYIVLLGFTLASFAAENIFLRTRPVSAASIWQSLFLLPPPSVLIIGVSWTLTHEIFFYVIFCAGIVAGRKIAICGSLLWLLVIVLYPHPQSGTFSQICDFAFSPVNIEFLAGLLTAWAVRKYQNRLAPKIILVSSIILLITGFTLGWWHNFYGERIPASVIEKTGLSLCCCGIIFGLTQIEAAHELKLPPFILLLGTASYSIYLVHSTAIRLVSYPLSLLFPSLFDRPASMQIVLILLAGVGIGSGLIYYGIVEAPLLRLARKWIGAEERRIETRHSTTAVANSK